MTLRLHGYNCNRNRIILSLGGSITMARRGKDYGGKGENAYLSIACLYPNDRSPIRKQLCAYKRFQTHFRMMTI